MHRISRVLLAAATLALVPISTRAQADHATITLAVDATNAPSRIVHSRETISVRPGPLTLLYPKWIPGEHGPTGPVIDVAGIKINASGTPITWRRDLENMFALHCTIPAGTTSIDVSLDFLLPPDASGFSSGASSSAKLLVLSWNQVLLYPATPRPDDITVTPSVTVPANWKFATALAASERSGAGGTIHFAPVSLTMLVDSPVIVGAYLRSIDLTPAGSARHTLNLVSDNEAAIAISADQITAYKNLVVEANTLFGAHHFEHFDFLFTLSDQVAHFGLEHHQSNDDRLAERSLIDDNLRRAGFDLLPHEFVHSWNGKFRRPAGLATGDFSTPMKGDLLWVYEGLTHYLGKLLGARAALVTPAEYRENLALLAAQLDNRPGRTWRPLQDTNDEAQLLYYTRADWDSWRRTVDYYDEGDLIWLEADATIRRLTNGQKSLDDFCKKFHGAPSTGPMVKPYMFEEVVTTMNSVAPYDWKSFFETRLQSLSPRAPMGGIEATGWKLAFSDTPTSMHVAQMASRGVTDLFYSIGILFSGEGVALDVLPDSPAAKAGVAPGMKVIAVNGRKYTADLIHDALMLGKTSSAPLELIAATGDFYNTYRIDYHGGERYPYLMRDPSKPDLLTTIITPAKK
jgi:predicted metalloprotease with PDZ domain